MKNIREAKASDCKLILELIRELAKFERLSHQVEASEQALSEHLFSPNPKTHVLIAEVDGVGVGFALYFYSFSTFLAKPGIYLEDLYVQEAYRSQGIGSDLLQKLAKIAKEQKLGRLEWSVLDWNKKAIDFYLRLGALPMSEWTVFHMNESAISKFAEKT